jgi:hypothetical protein
MPVHFLHLFLAIGTVKNEPNFVQLILILHNQSHGSTAPISKGLRSKWSTTNHIDNAHFA